MEPTPSLLRLQSHVKDGGGNWSSLIRLSVGEEHCLRTRLERLAFFRLAVKFPAFMKLQSSAPTFKLIPKH